MKTLEVTMFFGFMVRGAGCVLTPLPAYERMVSLGAHELLLEALYLRCKRSAKNRSLRPFFDFRPPLVELRKCTSLCARRRIDGLRQHQTP